MEKQIGLLIALEIIEKIRPTPQDYIILSSAFLITEINLL